VSIGEELALRASLDPAWLAVFRVYLDGAARCPEQFHARPPTSRPSPDPPAGEDDAPARPR
jgi:hypothetical protein